LLLYSEGYRGSNDDVFGSMQGLAETARFKLGTCQIMLLYRNKLFENAEYAICPPDCIVKSAQIGRQ
jgi:hypothetical protein